jgi:RNA polymerase sigma-70 factor (ECF subfamily)
MALAMRTGELAMIDEPGVSALASVELAQPTTSYETGLLEKLRKGDRLAYEQFVAEYHQMVYSLALRLVGDIEEARDITQETFLKVFRHLGSFREEAGLKTWIYRIAINQASNHQRWWRRRKKDWTVSLDQSVSSDDDSLKISDTLRDSRQTPEQQAIAHQRDKQLMIALGQLKHDYRVAVVLRDIEGLSYEEIAETLAISLGTVKSRIARGREDLRQRLKDFL